MIARMRQGAHALPISHNSENKSQVMRRPPAALQLFFKCWHTVDIIYYFILLCKAWVSITSLPWTYKPPGHTSATPISTWWVRQSTGVTWYDVHVTVCHCRVSVLNWWFLLHSNVTKWGNRVQEVEILQQFKPSQQVSHHDNAFDPGHSHQQWRLLNLAAEFFWRRQSPFWHDHLIWHCCHH